MSTVTGQALTDNEIYERILDAVLEHRLAPGTKLVEEKLGQAFGVSRTRIHQVLVRLANEQVVTLTHNRGASVSSPTPEEAREVFQARRLIEPPLLEAFIAAANKADIRALAEIIDQEEAARAQNNRRLAIRYSGEFHLHIAEGSRNRTLEKMLRELVSRTSLILMTYGTVEVATPGCGCDEHRGLLEAIEAGDATSAKRLMKAHLKHIEGQLNFEPDDQSGAELIRLFRLG